jgi:hypothetical protein
VVYAKPPFGGPQHVLHYLARYTHRVAISNHRITNVADGQVTFRWKDYARGSKQRTMAVSSEEFLRRFLLHVPPRGFVRIRFFGFLANRRRKQPLPLCQRLLETISPPRPPALPAGEAKLSASWLCPRCGGVMVLVERFTAEEIRWKLVTDTPWPTVCVLRHAPWKCVRARQNSKNSQPYLWPRTKTPCPRPFLLHPASLDKPPVGNPLLSQAWNPIQNP